MFQEIQEGCGGKILVLRSTAVRICVCGYFKKKEDIPKNKDGILHMCVMYIHVFAEHEIHGNEEKYAGGNH